MTDWDPEAFTKALIEDMRAHGGRPSTGPMADRPLMVLTTTGARTGEPRTAIVTFHRDGDRYVIAASKGGADENPAWYQNLLTHPEVTVEADNETFKARATDTTGAERDRLWNDHVAARPEFGEYPKMTKRIIPMIVLERADGRS
ncbi:MAG TPA: nitroreductase/quinone reductase family protein [Candidatus Limnocylindrales bacterium]|jgi:deazaflavin-dependent oxidoreductase (nitroreductase family)|nr:nitroreductase/quinone reductase family protein [Candidatus Limnocylindrales bacterium]